MSLTAKLSIVVMAAACLAGCVDPVVARRVLSEDGYTNIVLAERSGFSGFFAGCDRHYQSMTPFDATLLGHRVDGVVCSSGPLGKTPQVRRYH